MGRGDGPRVKRLAALGALCLLVVGSAVALEPSSSALEELRQRGLRKIGGTVEGRIYVERTRPNAPDTALPGVGVLLVPRSVDLLDRLESAKRNARESVKGFREAAPTVRTVLDEYEHRLWEAGYPEVAVRTSTDADGAFRAEVPAGAWLLVAERSVFVATTTPRASPTPTAQALDPLARYTTSQYQHFLPSARLLGFDAVTVWLREIDVGAGGTIALDLHDRGIWLSGVAEEADVPRRGRFAPKGGRSR
jgi:hypothetical protein